MARKKWRKDGYDSVHEIFVAVDREKEARSIEEAANGDNSSAETKLLFDFLRMVIRGGRVVAVQVGRRSISGTKRPGGFLVADILHISAPPYPTLPRPTLALRPPCHFFLHGPSLLMDGYKWSEASLRVSLCARPSRPGKDEGPGKDK